MSLENPNASKESVTPPRTHRAQERDLLLQIIGKKRRYGIAMNEADSLRCDLEMTMLEEEIENAEKILKGNIPSIVKMDKKLYLVVDNKLNLQMLEMTIAAPKHVIEWANDPILQRIIIRDPLKKVKMKDCQQLARQFKESVITDDDKELYRAKMKDLMKKIIKWAKRGTKSVKDSLMSGQKRQKTSSSESDLNESR